MFTNSYISIPVFLASFIIGLIFVYILGPDMKTVYVYPSPENVKKILFKDKADNCFYFNERTIECPTDETLITDIPIQT